VFPGLSYVDASLPQKSFYGRAPTIGIVIEIVGVVLELCGDFAFPALQSPGKVE
jgi:hypothetical protein